MDLLFFFCYIQCVFDYEEVKYIEFVVFNEVFSNVRYIVFIKIMDSSFM